MRILIAIETYLPGGRAGGTGTWADTMRGALEKKGHQVHTIDKTCRAHGLYDLALIAHGSMVERLKGLDCPKVMTCHGVIPPQEQPVDGADHYVAVSEEVRDHMATKGFDAEIIRNPINVERFCPPYYGGDRPFGTLASRYATKKVQERTRKACQISGLWFGEMGRALHWEEPKEAYFESSVVFALGRTALEAAACGCNVIVYDYNGGDGILTPETWFKYRKCNFSGRYHKADFTAEELSAFIRYDATPENGAALREFVVEHNEAGKIADKYLKFAT